MEIPVGPRIGALVLATTAFYGYVGQMVPQNEVQPPAEILIRADLTTPEMVEIGRDITTSKGLCRTCHTIGQTVRPRFPDLEGVDVRAMTRVPGLSDIEYPRPVHVRTRQVRRARIQSGDAPNQQTSDRSHRSGNSLCDRVPPVPRRHADGHAPNGARLLHAAGCRRARRGGRTRCASGPGGRARRSAAVLPPRRAAPGTVPAATPAPHAGSTPATPAPAAEPGDTMNILIVLAVVAVFGLLRFRRANLLLWAGAWWVGLYASSDSDSLPRFPRLSSRSTWASSRLRSWPTSPPAWNAAKKSSARSFSS